MPGREKVTVYVDTMKAAYGQMIMCHMMADTDEELHEMADRIGVKRRWHQKAGTPHSHYDICLSKRKLAISFGARVATNREMVEVIRRKRLSRQMTAP